MVHNNRIDVFKPLQNYNRDFFFKILGNNNTLLLGKLFTHRFTRIVVKSCTQ